MSDFYLSMDLSAFVFFFLFFFLFFFFCFFFCFFFLFFFFSFVFGLKKFFRDSDRSQGKRLARTDCTYAKNRTPVDHEPRFKITIWFYGYSSKQLNNTNTSYYISNPGRYWIYCKTKKTKVHVTVVLFMIQLFCGDSILLLISRVCRTRRTERLVENFWTLLSFIYINTLPQALSLSVVAHKNRQAVTSENVSFPANIQIGLSNHAVWVGSTLDKCWIAKHHKNTPI